MYYSHIHQQLKERKVCNFASVIIIQDFMDNIFSPTTNDLIKQYDINNHKELLEVIFRYIPLELDDNIPFKSTDLESILFNNLQIYIDDKKTIDIEKIAQLTLKLCDKYIIDFFKIPFQTKPFINNDIDFIKNNFFTEHLRQLKKTWNDKDYLDELKFFLILFLEYKNSAHDKPISHSKIIQFLTNSLEFKTGNYETLTRIKLTSFKNFFKIKPDDNTIKKCYLDAFFPALQQSLSLDKHTFTFNSYYDSIIFAGLSKSFHPKSNPFLFEHSSDLSYDKYNVNMKKFLNAFNCKKYTITTKNSQYIYYNPLVSNIYNQFVLERLSNANFINLLYGIKQKLHYIPNLLFELSSFPLLKTRINLLTIFEKSYQNNNNHMFVKEFESYFSSKINAVITTTISIASIVSTYLFYLLKSRNIIIESTSFFDNISENNKYHLFKSTEDLLPLEGAFPTNIKSIDYQSIIRSVISLNNEQTNNFANKNNFVKIITNSYREQEKFLIYQLNSHSDIFMV